MNKYQEHILFVLELLEEIQINSTTPFLYRWCEEQKKYWKEEYAKPKTKNIQWSQVVIGKC